MSRVIAFSLCLLFCFSILGCGDANPEATAISEVNQDNMQRLANLYSMYQMKNSFQGPADEAEFKSFVTSISPTVLEPMGVDPADVDSLFISERDNQPFTIRYGVESGPRGSQEPVIFESTGVAGKRRVGFLNMVQREVDTAEYDQLLAGDVPASAPVGSGERRSGS